MRSAWAILLVGMPGGLVLGGFFGFFGSIAAMALGGGGGSHNDAGTAVFFALLGAFLGTLSGPLVILFFQRVQDLARMVATERMATMALRSGLGFAGLLFASGTALYYSQRVEFLAELDRGGPSIPGRIALFAAVAMFSTAIYLLVRAIRACLGRRTWP